MCVCVPQNVGKCTEVWDHMKVPHFYGNPFWPEALFSLQSSLLQSPAKKGIYVHSKISKDRSFINVKHLNSWLKWRYEVAVPINFSIYAEMQSPLCDPIPALAHRCHHSFLTTFLCVSVGWSKLWFLIFQGIGSAHYLVGAMNLALHCPMHVGVHT